MARIYGGSDRLAGDPFEWGLNPRTMHVAHKHIVENFDYLESGSVVDVEFILRETKHPKESEAHAYPTL